MQVPLVESTTCYTIARQVSGFTEFLTENIKDKRREKLPTQARLPSYFPSTLVRRVRHAHVIECWCHPTSPQLGSLSRCPACRQPKRRHFSRGGEPLSHIMNWAEKKGGGEKEKKKDEISGGSSRVSRLAGWCVVCVGRKQLWCA